MMENNNEKPRTVEVLDKGYVMVRDVMGSDLSVVNAARVSYDKASFELSDRDRKLIAFLAREGHTSPFRHAVITFEVYAPLMVARQWWKYAVGSDHIMDAWNESSRRYVTEEPTFYVPMPDEWRSKPANSKQGSGEPIPDNDLQREATESLIDYIEQGERLYTRSIELGIAPEQARLFLPAYGMYVRWHWTASLQSVAHFIVQRTADDAQYEIREYGKAVEQLAREAFPVSIDELVKHG